MKTYLVGTTWLDPENWNPRCYEHIIQAKDLKQAKEIAERKYCYESGCCGVQYIDYIHEYAEYSR